LRSVLDLERRGHQIVDVVDLRARQVAEREGVDQHLDTSGLDQDVFGLRVGHEIETVLKARAADALDALTRSMLFSGSLETICAMRSAARLVTVIDAPMTCVPSL
jgi:hypothetical protein